MAALKDTPLSTPWPGPEGGTLKTVSLNAPYGNSGQTLRNTPLSAPWPPVYGTTQPPTVQYRTLAIKYGGSSGAGALDGETHMETLDYMDISSFKLEPGNVQTAYRAANPTGRILCYKISVETAAGGSDPLSVRVANSVITRSQMDAHDAAFPNDKWTLTLPGGAPAVTPSGEHCLDIGKSSAQAQVLANMRALASSFGLIAGRDGFFFDNIIADATTMMNGQPSQYPTMAAWRAALLNYVQNVCGVLKAEGWYVVANALAPDDNTGSGIKQWWSEISAYISGAMQEGWMSTWADRRRMRKDSLSSWQDLYRTWADILNGMQASGGDAFPTQIIEDSAANYLAHETEIVYGRAAWLLKWHGGGGAYCVFFGGDSYNTLWRKDTGLPVAPESEVQTSVFRRFFDKAVVVLNAHVTNNYTIPSSPDGRAYTKHDGTAAAYPIVLGPGTAVILYTVQAPSGLSKTSSFKDNFDDGVLDAQWSVETNGIGAGTIAETAGGLVATIPLNSNSERGVVLRASDLTGSAAYCSFNQDVALTDVDQTVRFGVRQDQNTMYYWQVEFSSGTQVLHAYRFMGGTTVGLFTLNPYTPGTTHKFKRIRESGGSIFFETSSDGNTWTTQYSEVAAFLLNNIQVFLNAKMWTTAAPAFVATFDNFNIVTVSGSYDAAILAESALVAYYKLNEASGATQALDSKGTRHSTSVGAGATFGAVGPVTGGGTCAQFSGAATGFIALPSPGIASGSWAVEGLFRLDGPGSVGAIDWGAIMGNGYGDVGTSGRIIAHWGTAGSDAGPRVQAASGGANVQTPTTLNVANGVWHQFVFEYDGTNLHIYIDGVKRTSGAKSIDPNWLNAAWWLGSFDGFFEDYMFNGRIAKVSIYNAILGDTKVANHYALVV